MAEFVRFRGIQAKQSNRHEVVTFAATAAEISSVARIDRIGRTVQGDLFGFQRPQVATHIQEIRDYLKLEDSVLPNSVVLAFVDGITLKKIDGHLVEIVVDTQKGPPGFVVDGQQRLTALGPLEDRNFQLFVSAIICDSEEELRRQFILINNTRPLPKELIHELLPSVSNLPHRMTSRSFAAGLTTRLNYFDSDGGAALRGEIKQHTNPSGTISSNAIQKVIMNSRLNGALRNYGNDENTEEKSVQLVSDFYGAVMDVFPEAWIGMSPRTSRLKHSVGIIAMGYAMEVAFTVHGARNREQFAEKLRCLVDMDCCAWTNGLWNFGDESRIWDRLQNTPPDIRLLSDFIVRAVRDQGAHASVSGPRPNPSTEQETRLTA